MERRIEITERLAGRFWRKVRKSSGCWEWTARTTRGYGQFYTGSIPGCRHETGAHRMSWIITNDGLIPPPEMFVCHHCDNKICVRPDHLFLGDNLANVQDLRAKGLNLFGERHPRSKLTEDQIREIRERYASGKEFYREIAPDYGISIAHAHDIVTRQIWKHVV